MLSLDLCVIYNLYIINLGGDPINIFYIQNSKNIIPLVSYIYLDIIFLIGITFVEKNNTISGWGNFPTIKAKITKVKSINHLIETVKRLKTVIYYGNGRSYGDSALNKRMVQYQRLNKPIDFNPETGIVHINADVLIGDLIDYILPLGWFPPVVPGTKFVTIGGAIAADIMVRIII